ncbi:hypothetical protein ACQKKX_02955 [Neorhizobium sp. NPDC001467]|uniref:hypothetical protein n=1 Tax=Neorhizobium sp. NPDC001467 TaxID=3390595 RepID=UPI003D07E801
MTKLEQIEKSVAELTGEELEAFSDWFDSFQAARWDERIESDSTSGKLDGLAEGALAEFEARRTRPL